jgi:hypothetical protein
MIEGNHIIHDTEVPKLIEALIDFLGKNKVDKSLSKYQKFFDNSRKLY